MKNKIKSKKNMKSYVQVSVFGVYTEAFINTLLKKGIKVENIINKDGIIFFNCSPRKYPAAAKTARSYGLKTRILERSGIYFKLRKYKKRYGAVLGAFCFAFIIVFMNNFIWDIRVTGNETLTAEQITEQLEKEGIHIGTQIKSYSAPAAELSLKLALDRLAWVNIERVGSRLLVKVSERLEDNLPNIPVSEPCNVIATKTGRIVETEIYRGKLLLEKGSGVNKGDIIVSGIVEDGAENILLSHADAKIVAECEDEAEFFIPFTEAEKKKNGNIDRNNYLVFLGNLFPLFIGSANNENMYYSEETRNPTFFGLPLPFNIKTCIYVYYDIVEVTYNSEETLEKLNKQIELYKSNFFGKDEIITFDVEYIAEETGITAKTKAVYRTNIAYKKEIIIN